MCEDGTCTTEHLHGKLCDIRHPWDLKMDKNFIINIIVYNFDKIETHHSRGDCMHPWRGILVMHNFETFLWTIIVKRSEEIDEL